MPPQRSLALPLSPAARGVPCWLAHSPAPDTLAGFALAGGGTSFGVSNIGSGRSGLLQAGAYMRHNIGAAYVTGALAYGGKTVTDPRSELGVRTDKSFALLGAVLTLRGRQAWMHDYNPDQSVGATFTSLPGASFVVNGAAQPRDAWLSTAAAEVKFVSGWALAASLESQWAPHATSYSGKGSVRFQW